MCLSFLSVISEYYKQYRKQFVLTRNDEIMFFVVYLANQIGTKFSLGKNEIFVFFQIKITFFLAKIVFSHSLSVESTEKELPAHKKIFFSCYDIFFVFFTFRKTEFSLFAVPEVALLK